MKEWGRVAGPTGWREVEGMRLLRWGRAKALRSERKCQRRRREVSDSRDGIVVQCTTRSPFPDQGSSSLLPGGLPAVHLTQSAQAAITAWGS